MTLGREVCTHYLSDAVGHRKQEAQSEYRHPTCDSRVSRRASGFRFCWRRTRQPILRLTSTPHAQLVLRGESLLLDALAIAGYIVKQDEQSTEPTCLERTRKGRDGKNRRNLLPTPSLGGSRKVKSAPSSPSHSLSHSPLSPTATPP
jgi:hypothetical protein